LLQSVEVTFVGAPKEGDFLALFSLVEGCGLKPPKEPEAKTDAPAETETDSAPSDT
jgi:predicted small lipoprotein YifL